MGNRKLKVSTIFTGAMALAVTGLVAQTANAQEVVNAKPAKTMTVRNIQQPARAIRAAGITESSSIREAACTSGRDHWLHIVSIYQSEILCYGFRGVYLPTSEIGIYDQCGGNNYGYLVGIGDSYAISYGPGTTYRVLNKPHLSQIVDYGWAGNDTCSPR
jgi:hypothetical protein